MLATIEFGQTLMWVQNVSVVLPERAKSSASLRDRRFGEPVTLPVVTPHDATSLGSLMTFELKEHIKFYSSPELALILRRFPCFI